MRLIFENIDFTIVGHMQSLLESEGIATELRNSGASGLAGEVPYTQVYPELWLLDHRDESRARALIRDYRTQEAATPVGPDWICPKCGESVEGVFAECWNCRAPSPVGVSRTGSILGYTLRLPLKKDHSVLNIEHSIYQPPSSFSFSNATNISKSL